MISKRLGTVKSIIREFDDIQELEVEFDEKISKAYNYIKLSGTAKIGDRTILNTTAVELSLGTGGYHYVIANLDNAESKQSEEGHMMKLRYTPYQVKVNMVEEQERYREVFDNFSSLENMPVVSGNLHSMLAPFVTMLAEKRPGTKVAYIMTDGASLPAWFSRNIKNLKNRKLIDSVITIGNAIGGDYECMNIYSALITAKEIVKADAVFVGMGPGIAGTGTKYGFSGIEQGPVLDAVKKLGGVPVAIPRISFADKRERHYGISHHSLTVLSEIVNTDCKIAFCIYDDEEKNRLVKEQIKKYGLEEKHEIEFIRVTETKDVLDKFGIKVRTMGRNYDEDSEFFDSAAASALVALEYL